MSVFELCGITPSVCKVFVMHCPVGTNGGFRHPGDYKLQLITIKVF